MAEVAVLKDMTDVDYDRHFLGMSVTIANKERVVLDIDDFEALNKNCVNFQQMTNPPHGGGEPHIRITGSASDGGVVVNAKGLGEPTLFTAPRVRLKADGKTKVSKGNFKKLKKDPRFQNLIEANDIKFVGWSSE